MLAASSGADLGEALGHGTSGEVCAPHPVYLHHHDSDLVSHLNHILNPFHPVVRQLTDVDQTFLSGQDLNEGPEVHEPGHFTRVDSADLDLLGEAFDNLYAPSW